MPITFFLFFEKKWYNHISTILVCPMCFLVGNFSMNNFRQGVLVAVIIIIMILTAFMKISAVELIIKKLF